jgi:hypothetical protein
VWGAFEDSLGAKLRWAYDPLLRVRARREIGALGLEVLTTTTFVMGPGGARVERHDAEGRTTTFLYDGALRLQASGNGQNRPVGNA